MSNHAIDVIEEAGKEYYSNFNMLPAALKEKLSCEMLDNIFKKMVIPAVEKARSLDRVERNNHIR